MRVGEFFTGSLKNCPVIAESRFICQLSSTVNIVILTMSDCLVWEASGGGILPSGSLRIAWNCEIHISGPEVDDFLHFSFSLLLHFIFIAIVL